MVVHQTVGLNAAQAGAGVDAAAVAAHLVPLTLGVDDAALLHGGLGGRWLGGRTHCAVNQRVGVRVVRAQAEGLVVLHGAGGADAARAAAGVHAHQVDAHL